MQIQYCAGKHSTIKRQKKKVALIGNINYFLWSNDSIMANFKQNETLILKCFMYSTSTYLIKGTYF